ncbi:MAG: hypothetical protein V8R91_12985 [Butyricimonas faecihominis]
MTEVYTLFKSTAVLVAIPKLDEEKMRLVEQLIFRMKAVLAAKCNKYILLNAPEEKLEEICDILPGEKPDNYAVGNESVLFLYIRWVNENKFGESIGALKAAGAEGILVVPIEKDDRAIACGKLQATG